MTEYGLMSSAFSHLAIGMDGSDGTNDFQKKVIGAKRFLTNLGVVNPRKGCEMTSDEKRPGDCYN